MTCERYPLNKKDSWLQSWYLKLNLARRYRYIFLLVTLIHLYYLQSVSCHARATYDEISTVTHVSSLLFSPLALLKYQNMGKVWKKRTNRVAKGGKGKN